MPDLDRKQIMSRFYLSDWFPVSWFRVLFKAVMVATALYASWVAGVAFSGLLFG